MTPLAHRGYWIGGFPQNHREAFERSFAQGFGVETDFRDHKRTLVIAHDAATEDAMPAENFFTSNALPQTVNLLMRRSRLLGYLNVMLGNDNVALPKPGSDIYLDAARRLGIRPLQRPVLIDSANGIEAAPSAGCILEIVVDTAEVTHTNISAAIAALRVAFSDHPPFLMGARFPCRRTD